MGKIIQANDIQEELFHLHKYGQNAGLKIGFSNLDKLYSIKKGRSTIIYGHPTSGKSQFLIQTLCALATKHNKKCLIYTPETGSAHEIYAEIIHCLTGKTFDKRSINYQISEKELYTVYPFVQDYFKVIDVDEKGLDFDEWLNLTDEAIRDYGIFSSSVDNWNDIEHKYTNTISEYLKQQLPRVNRHARKNNTHNFIVAHARNPDMRGGDKYPPAPRPDEIEGGSVWYAKALNLICVHRDYEEHGEGWRQSSEAQIIIRKIKKRAEGEKGTAKLTFDVFRNAYYENLGERHYLETPFNNIQQTKNQFNNLEITIAPF